MRSLEGYEIAAEDDTFVIDLLPDLPDLFPAGEDQVETGAILVCHDLFPGAVLVAVGSSAIGKIPARLAPAWHAFVTRLEAERLRPVVSALLVREGSKVSVALRADPAAAYRTPGEERAARQTDRVSRLHARATGRCRDCGGLIEAIPGQRGRPPVRCASCRSTRPPARSVLTAAAPWPHEPATTDWSVIDLETTGLWPSIDRIVEIGVVRLSPEGREVDSWTTLVDPDRDVGASEIHGLTAFDLRGAPRFSDLAPSLLAMFAGTRLAAHNARFDTSFLSCEFARAGIDWGTPDALCTMNTASRLGLTSSRRLSSACVELGIEHLDEHCAISDARAASELLARALGHLDAMPAVVPWLMDAPVPPPSRLRTDPPLPRLDHSLGSMADRVGVPGGLAISDASASAYLALLDRVLEDRKVTDHEVSALASVAAEWGIGTDAVRSLHHAYFGGVWELARADGVVTDAEARDLAILAELLGVPLDTLVPAVSLPIPQADDFRGRSVCFTGASVVTIRGLSLQREDQERFAAEAGLVVKANVSRKLDILVLADPDSRSGKSKLADELGVRKMAEPVFWRALGAPID